MNGNLFWHGIVTLIGTKDRCIQYSRKVDMPAHQSKALSQIKDNAMLGSYSTVDDVGDHVRVVIAVINVVMGRVQLKKNFNNNNNSGDYSGLHNCWHRPK